MQDRPAGVRTHLWRRALRDRTVGSVRDQDPIPYAERAMSKLPPLAVLLTHTVQNFDLWKRAFDGHQAARKGAPGLAF